MFHCYRERSWSDNKDALLSADSSMVSLISTRSNYSTILTMGHVNIASLIKRTTAKRSNDSAMHYSKYREDMESNPHSRLNPIPSISINVPMLSIESTVTVSYSAKENVLCITYPVDGTVTENSINNMKWLSRQKMEESPYVFDKLTAVVTAKCEGVATNIAVREVTEITSCNASKSLRTMKQSQVVQTPPSRLPKPPKLPNKPHKIKMFWKKVSAKILDCNCLIPSSTHFPDND